MIEFDLVHENHPSGGNPAGHPKLPAEMKELLA
jgi:hypothetical protein